MSNENKIDDGDQVQLTQKPSRLGLSSLEGNSVGGEDRRSADVLYQEGDSRRPIGEDPSKLRDHLGHRSGTRIPGTRVVDPSETLLKAFLDGDFEKAYHAAEDLRAAYHEALNEGARLRYRSNFGTDACEHCDGLKAGPGVLATCFQLQKCNYDSIHEGSESSLHLKIIDRLSLK
jgi:hypothetical protein